MNWLDRELDRLNLERLTELEEPMKWDIRKTPNGAPLAGVTPFEAETEDEAREIAMVALGYRVSAHQCTVENCACKARETETKKDTRKQT